MSTSDHSQADKDVESSSMNAASDGDDAKDTGAQTDAAQEEDVASKAVKNGESNADDATEPMTPFLENVGAPIDAESPAGESILYDEVFRRLKAQIDHIGSASAEANYEEIVELARTLLTEKAKDLRAAGYLVIGEARLNGSEGVAEAIHAARILIDSFWDDLFPAKSRMRGRGSALQFIADRLPAWLDHASFEQEDRVHLVRALEHLSAIQEFSLEEMGEHAPSLSGLMSDLEGEIRALPESEPEQDPEPESDSEPSSGTADDGSASDATETTSPKSSHGDGGAPEEVTSETDALQSIRTVAGYYREKDRTSPLSYRLVRTVRWGTLRSEPPNEEGRTRFEAPREQRCSYLEGLLEDGEYETLVREGESSFQSGTFHVWLDLQRLIVAALDALGASYRDARDAIVFDLAHFIGRVRGLLSLAYSDGTPFATPLTVDWIETEVLPRMEGDGDGASASGDGNGLGAVTEDYEEARSALSGGNLERALSLMNEGAAADASRKEEFQRQLYVASLCVKGGQPRVARPLLDELDIAIDTHNLDAWNPSLALEVWTTRCQCYDLLTKNAPPDDSESLRSEAEATFAKICQIDPEHAVTVDSRRAK